jgi:hypothetical protein
MMGTWLKCRSAVERRFRFSWIPLDRVAPLPAPSKKLDQRLGLRQAEVMAKSLLRFMSDLKEMIEHLFYSSSSAVQLAGLPRHSTGTASFTATT